MKGNGNLTREQHEELGTQLKELYALAVWIQGHLLEAYPIESVMYKAATCICGGENDNFQRIRTILEDKLRSEMPNSESIEGVYYPEYDLQNDDPTWVERMIEFEEFCGDKPTDNILSAFYSGKGLSERALGKLKMFLFVLKNTLFEWLEDVPLYYQDASLMENIDHTLNAVEDLKSIVSHEISLHKVLNEKVIQEAVH